MSSLRWIVRLAAALAAVGFMLGVLSVPASAEDNTTRMYIEPASSSIHNSDEIDLKVYIDVGDDDELAVADADISYPANLIQCVSTSGSGSAFEGFFNLPEACDDGGTDDGRVTIAGTAGGTVSNPEYVVGKHQLLGTIRFRGDAVNDGTADVVLNFSGPNTGSAQSEAYAFRRATQTTERVLDAVSNAQIKTK